MGRTIGSVCKRCRREGVKLFLKGTRCDSARCALDRRKVAPGMHGAKRGKMTDYGTHLREKQKVKTFYGVLEKQFRKYFQMAERAKGNTGKVLMILLERRLDNVVYRLGFASSRAAARQLVAHGHILVNGGRLDVPSYLVRPGDQIAAKSRESSVNLIKSVLADTSSRQCDFLVRNDSDIPSGVVLRDPVADDISIAVESQLIVELCSR